MDIHSPKKELPGERLKEILERGPKARVIRFSTDYRGLQRDSHPGSSVQTDEFGFHGDNYLLARAMAEAVFEGEGTEEEKRELYAMLNESLPNKLLIEIDPNKPVDDSVMVMIDQERVRFGD